MTQHPVNPSAAPSVHQTVAQPQTTPVPTEPRPVAARPARSRRSRRVWPWLLLLVLAALVTVYLLRRGSATPAVKYDTATATQGTVSILVNGPGTLSARANVPYPAPLSGTVSGLPAVGTVVKAGQVVGRLQDDTSTQAAQDAQLSLQKAQAALDAQRSSQAAGEASRVSSAAAARLSVQDAQNAVTTAQTTVAAQTRLYGVGAISRTDLDTARSTLQAAQNKLATAQASLSSALQQNTLGQASDAGALRSEQLAVDQARSALQQAQDTLSKQTLRAPAGGVITTVDAVNGANVGAGTSLMTIADTSAMELPVQIDETQIAQIRPGMLARATLDALDGQTVEGQVTSVSPSATVQNNISVFTVNVELPNPDGLLKAGMSAQTDVVVAEESGLTIPAKALQAVRTRSYVALLPQATVQAAQAQADANPAAQTTAQTTTQTSTRTSGTQSAASTLQVDDQGAATAVQTRVRVGLTDGTTTVVTGGLQEGDTVLLPQTITRTRTGTGTGSGTRSGTGTGTRGTGFGGPGGFGGF